MLSNRRFLALLRDALNNLYEPHRLRRSELALVFGVVGRHDTPAALQRILIEAIEALEPGPDEPAQSHAWQIYEPLHYRYVQQISQPEVADQLGLSVRHLRRKEQAALQTLASLLWDKYRLEVSADEGTSSQPAAEDEPESPALTDELSWLADARQRGPTSLDETLPGVLQLAQGLAKRYAVSLDIRAANGLPQVAADAVALRQSLLNLLGVAIPRATGGRVSISSRLQRWEVEIRVHCARYPSGPKPADSGEAASLSMAQRLAEMSGSRLVLGVDARAFDARLILPGVEQLPVLVIDDNSDALQLLVRYTSGTRYRLIATQDASQALALADQLAPAIVVLDVMMPELDGWEVLGQLRQHPLTRHIPIVVCTILPQDEWARYLGASAFIRKPVTREAFLAALDEQVALLEPESHSLRGRSRARD